MPCAGAIIDLMMDIRQADRTDFEAVLEMGLFLWPDEPEAQWRKELKGILSSAKQAVFVCLDDSGRYAGFIHVSARREYVSGATSFPVGYVEGIYVRPAYLRQGIARRLMETGESWAAGKGCQQMASDTGLWNTASQEFHKRLGFMEEERLVCYIKRIDKWQGDSSQGK